MHPLVVEHVRKTYRHGQVTALRDVSLDVPDSTFLAIMGASGSGKSTLLHLMAGLATADAGRIVIRDTDLGSLNDKALTTFRRRHIGLVFQSFNLIPTLSARENVALPLRLNRAAARSILPKVDRLLEILGLASRRDHRPDALSGGEQQRVAIGRALINDPTVILADEPTGNLDSQSGRGVCELLRDLAAVHRRTIVMVTHEPAVAAYAKEVAVLKDGCLVDRFATAGVDSSAALAARYQQAARQKKLMVLPRLILSHLRVHKVRTGLTAAAVAFSAALVVAVTSGYLSLETSAFNYLSRFTGFGDVEITSRSFHGSFDQSLTSEIRDDPAVRMAVGRLESQRSLLNEKGHPIAGSLAAVIGVDPAMDGSLALQSLQGGVWFDAESGNVAVVDQVAAQVCHTDVGKTILIAGLPQPLAVTVMGIVRKPQIIAEFHSQTIYMPLRTLQSLDHREGQITRIMIVLKDRDGADEFAARWSDRLAARGLVVRTARNTHEQQRKHMAGVRFLSRLGGVISLAAAAFIIFASLSAGVMERSRALAMLRAIGASRGQLVRLVLLEGLVIAALGVAFGVPLGWLLVRALARVFPLFFAAGAVLSSDGLLLAAGGALVAVIAAAALPAWMASRTDPLVALAQQGAVPSSRPGWICLACGLLLVAIDPLVVHSTQLPTAWMLPAHFFLGLPAEFVGLFLVAPSLIRFLECVAATPLARVLGVEPTLLRQQLSSGLWRAAGTCAALMISLAVLIVLQTQGRTLLSAWRLPQKFPDIFLWSPDGLDSAQQEALAQVPALRKQAILPVGYALVDLALASPHVNTDVAGGTTMLLGTDPERALSMMELEFRDDQGHPVPHDQQQAWSQRAAAALHKGRGVIITNELRELYGLKTGDPVPLRTPSGEVVTYRVAGIVWSPGVDVFIAVFDLGEEMDRPSTSCMVTAQADLSRDFGVDRINFFAANLRPGTEKTDLERGVKAALQPTTAESSWSLGRALSQLRSKIASTGIRSGDVRNIKDGITLGIHRMIMLISTVALAAMAVSALGVANAIMAGIRSRRWQLGVLRSIGLPRWALLRLILGEALLMGIVGCVMGLAAGLLISVDANALNRSLLGIDVPMLPPWDIISMATGVMMGVCLLAAIGPAIQVARTQPLSLLQAGRATV